MSTDEKIFINSSSVVGKASECSVFTGSVICFLGIGAVTVHSRALQRDDFYFFRCYFFISVQLLKHTIEYNISRLHDFPKLVTFMWMMIADKERRILKREVVCGFSEEKLYNIYIVATLW